MNKGTKKKITPVFNFIKVKLRDMNRDKNNLVKLDTGIILPEGVQLPIESDGFEVVAVGDSVHPVFTVGTEVVIRTITKTDPQGTYTEIPGAVIFEEDKVEYAIMRDSDVIGILA